MSVRRSLQIVFPILAILVSLAEVRGNVVVADARSRRPMTNVSVFDSKGHPVGVSSADGRLPRVDMARYPLTVRFLGYDEESIESPGVDTVFLSEAVTVLPEVVVSSRKHNILHLLAYVREYSTLSTYTDTVFLFREKMVDYMIPPDGRGRFKGWRSPRVLTSRSYFRFTDSRGLDSVSDRSSHHFSWADRIEILPPVEVSAQLRGDVEGTDTVRGRYSPTEVWTRRGYSMTLDIDVLADSSARKWVPNLNVFFRNNMDFDMFRLRFNYDGAVDRVISPEDLTGYAVTIESNGRGRGVYIFDRLNDPYDVSTYAEFYVVDSEYITASDAKKWERNLADAGMAEIFEAAGAPELTAAVRNLVERVNALDHSQVRTSLQPNMMLVGPPRVKLNFGQSVLQRIKGMFGLDYINAQRKWRRGWNDFRRSRSKR